MALLPALTGTRRRCGQHVSPPLGGALFQTGSGPTPLPRAWLPQPPDASHLSLTAGCPPPLPRKPALWAPQRGRTGQHYLRGHS